MGIILTTSQKLVCERVINVFETGSAAGNYGCVSIFHDGPKEIRQITYGRSQTTEYGNLAELVKMYADAHGKYSEDFAGYVPMIGKKPLVDNSVFIKLLKDAGKDPVMCATQDAFFDKAYFTPALNWASENGFTKALSALVIYDSFVHSGGILGDIRALFPAKTPAAGGDEKAWIMQYVAVRRHWLATHSRTILHATVYRPDCFLAEIKRGNWDLTQLPIMAHGVRVDDSQPHDSPSSPTLPTPQGEPTMTASATPAPAPVAPATTSISSHPAVAAAINSATLPLDNIWTKIMGMFSSAAWMGLGGAFSTLAPTATLNVLGALGVAAGLVSLIAHAYGLITRVSATNNATIMMAESMLQQLEAALGGKPLIFDNAVPKPGMQ